MKQTITIDNWSIVSHPGASHLAPERSKTLQGRIENHPVHGLIENACTSVILDINFDDRRVTTANSLYALGAIDPEYLAYAITNSSRWTASTLKRVYGKQDEDRRKPDQTDQTNIPR